MSKVLNIGYNFQGDNDNFGGKFSAWWQCFSTSVWMLLAFYSSKYRCDDDKQLAEYLDDVEETIGKPGIGEKIKQKYNWITGRTSLWFLTQRDGMSEWLRDAGVRGKAMYCDSDKLADAPRLIYDDIRYLINNNTPVVIATDKMGGLSGGHIIVVVGHDDDIIICHDPAGNALTNYANRNGEYVRYPQAYLQRYTGAAVRALYWRAV